MMKRCVLLFSVALGLASCNSARNANDAANKEYATDSYQQSLEAYRICAAQNPNDPQKCDALSRVVEADKKRYEKN
jgi:hypothetical protein